MENQEINENPVVSIKNDLIVLIAGAISLFILNWHINNYIEIIAGIILVIISGYGLSILFFPKKYDIDLLSRLILSPIFGIFLIGFWSILLNYTPYYGTNVYYELAIIPILVLLLIIRTIRFLRAKELFSSVSNIEGKKSSRSKLKNIKNNRKYDKEYNNLNTAQVAAKAEKEKLRKINKKIGTTESISGYVPSENVPKTSNNISKSKSSMPRPPSFAKYKKQAHDKKSDDNNSKGKSKTRFAFKSQKNNKTESSKELEIIKVRKSTKDIIFILILTLVSGLFIFLPLNSSVIKIPFTLIILFFVSGYCMLSGLFLNFSDHGLIKKIISSVLLSIVIVSAVASLLIFIKINIPYKYVLGIIVLLSLSMGILGYLRKTRKHKRVKESFKFEKKYPISEKSEFNVLSVSKSKDSSHELKDNSTEKNIFKKYTLKNAQEKPLQKMNIANKPSPEIKEVEIKSKSSDNIKNQSPPLKEKIPTMAFDENSSKEVSKKAALSPSDARKIVMSRKKDMEKSGQKKNKSSHIYDELEKDDKLDPKKNLKDVSDLPRNLSPLKLIAVIILSLIGIVFTIPPAYSISPVVDLVFILPILIYLPGYAIKKLFLPEKYPGIIFTSAISIFISLSLDILILFILLYIGHLLNQTGLNQSLYVGILAIISIICILMAFWISNKRANYDSVNDISKKKSEEDELKNIKSDKVSLDMDDSFDVKNKDDFGIGILKDDISLAKKELKKDPSFAINKKSEAKPVQKNYLEEELVKSFSTSDVFDDESQKPESTNKNPIKKPKNTNQKANNESKLDKILSIILIISLVLAIATTAYIIVKPKEGEKFTEFYILGPNGKASDYPTNLTLGQSGQLFVGVVNHEYSTVNYKVVVTLQGKNISTENISLKNNQKWEKLLNFTPDTSGPNQKLELLLYKLPDDKNAYRSLHLWVNVS